MSLLEAWAVDRGLFLDGRECPTAEDLWASAHGELDRAGNEDVVLHTARCPACAEGWRLARRDVAAGLPTAHRAWWSRTPGQIAAATILIAVMFGIGYRMMTRQAPPPAAYRDSASNWLVSALPEGEPLPRGDCLLRWAAGPQGTTYDVLVTTDTLEPLTEVWRIDRSELLLDTEMLNDLPDGSELFWRVTAHPPDGRQIRSRTFRTRVD